MFGMKYLSDELLRNFKKQFMDRIFINVHIRTSSS